jgi:ParB family chromosome partitioning protein
MAEDVGTGKPRRLGRGLSGLLSAPVQVTPPPVVTRQGDDSSGGDVQTRDPEALGVRWVSVGAVAANPWQPRREFDEAALQGLAASIKQSGVLQPIVVRPVRDQDVSDTTKSIVGYELIAGERRWRAAQMAGLETVPAVVREVSDREAAEWALVENLQREDLNPIDQAAAFKRLAEEFGLTQAQIAERVGVERSTVANVMRLAELDDETRGLVVQKKLSAGHAKVLLGIPAVQAGIRASMAKRAVREEWSVRRTEREVATFLIATDPNRRPMVGGAESTGTVVAGGPRVAEAELERRLSEHLGTRVNVLTDATGKNGRIVIQFFGLDQLDGLLRKVGVGG